MTSSERKIIVDHSLSEHLRSLLVEHQVFSARYFGWEELANGDLLQRSVDNNFEIFLTADKNIKWQNDLTQYPIFVLVVSTNNWDLLRRHIAIVKAAIENIGPDQIKEIELPQD